VTEKLEKKYPVNTCTILRYDDVSMTSLKNAIFARRKTPQSILPLMTLSLQRQCCISGAVVSQGASRPATVISSTVFVVWLPNSPDLNPFD